MDRFTIKARAAWLSITIAVLLSFLFNTATIVVYSQESGAEAKSEAAAKAEEAAKAAKARAEAAKLAAEKAEATKKHHHKSPSPKSPSPKPPSPKPPSPTPPSPTPPSPTPPSPTPPTPPPPSAKNVRNYGAIGNGTTDDSQAFKAALAAAGSGGTIYAPGGYTYALGKQIALNSQSLIGDGSTTKLKGITYVSGNPSTSSSNALLVMTGSGGSISQVALSCVAPLSNNAGMTAIYVSATTFSIQDVVFQNSTAGSSASTANFAYCMFLNNASGGTISNCALQALGLGGGVYMADGGNVAISGNSMNVNMAGIAVTTVNTPIISGVTISQNQFQFVPNGINPVHNNGIWPSAISLAGGVSGCQITSNTFTGVSSNDTIYQGILVSSGAGILSNLQISGNQFINSGSPSGQLPAINLQSAATTPYIMQNVTITKNTFTQRSGSAVGNSSWSVAIATDWAGWNGMDNSFYGLTISDNIINTAGSGGIFVYAGSGTNITGNTITSRGEGVTVIAYAGPLNISNNKFPNCGIDTIPSSYPPRHEAVIDVEPGLVSPSGSNPITMTGNSYSGSANNLKYCYYDGVSQSVGPLTFSGNTDSTALPNYLAP